MLALLYLVRGGKGSYHPRAMRLQTLFRQRAQKTQRILRDRIRECERELISDVGVRPEISNFEGVLPQEDAHPLLGHGDVGSLEFVVETVGRVIVAELLLSKGKGIAR